MAKNTVQSVEPNIADLVNGWLKSYKVDYKLEQESLNTEIDQALNDYFSKNGGKGGNRPDAKLNLQANDGKYYPILIEYKGYKDKLVKLDAEGNVANRNAKNQPDYTNINSYAVNGAVHYSNAVLHYTSYTDVIAIGVTGYKDASGKLKHMVNGKLSEARFQMLSDDYEQEQADLRAKIEMLENEIQNQEDQAENVDRFIRQAKKYLYLEKLTPTILNDMVNAVYVHAPDKSSGHRVQDVTISYNYIGILPANLLYDVMNGKAA